MLCLETDKKKSVHSKKKIANNKNPQFLSNLNETWSILPAHELEILTELH